MGRFLVMRVPSWSVVAALNDASLVELSPGEPLAVVEAGVVRECSSSASDQGVRAGMKRREAHGVCPGVRLVPHSPQRDRAAFDALIVWLSGVVAQHTLLRPGLLAFQARGLARFYGGEAAAACALIAAAASYTPTLDARVGIADDLFSAVVAAIHAPAASPWVSVPPGQSANFLADFPLDVLEDHVVVPLLQRLGVFTVGQCVALGERALRERFGVAGEQLYRLATGADPRRLSLADAPIDPRATIDLPEPYTVVEHVAFGIRAATDEYTARLGAAGYVCTRVRIEIVFDDGTRRERVWVHPRFFTAPEIVDRVRWQLEQYARDAAIDDERAPGVVSVRYTTENPEDHDAHEPGLWGQGPDTRVHQVFSRVQGLVGAHGVLTARVRRARHAAHTHELTTWGDTPAAEALGPLPGSLPRPLPATVFAEARPVDLVDAAGSLVVITPEGISGDPASVVWRRKDRHIASWAGPWPVYPAWPQHAPVRYRLQVLDDQGIGWLLSADEHSRWSIDARYD